MDFELYPFLKLNDLLKDLKANENYEEAIVSIGEPVFKAPDFIKEEIIKNIDLINKYPKAKGEDFLIDSIREFIQRRFNISLLNDNIVTVFGTREVLFNFPQYYLNDIKSPVMAFTNPFYAIYQGSAIASGAKIKYINLTKENNFKPLLDEDYLKDSDLIVLNFPNNPTGSVLSLDELSLWLEFALKHNILLINDECYSDIYFNTKPPSLLEACFRLGNKDFKNVLVFNSLSKRSSVPGIRSGFVAGDKDILNKYLKYRTYLGVGAPLYLQMAGAKAWSDDTHVEEFRKKYQKNLNLLEDILGLKKADSTFFAWIEVKDDIEFTKRLYQEYNLKVLPGSYMGAQGLGKGFIRLALIYEEQKIRDILKRVKDCLKSE